MNERFPRRRHVRLATTAVAMVTVAAMITACGSSRSPSVTHMVTRTHTRTTHTTTVPAKTVTKTVKPTTKTTTTSTDTSAQLHTCSPSVLALSGGPSSAGLGSFIQSFALTNHGHVSCVLGGWPGFQVVNAAGRPVKTKMARTRTTQPPGPAWKPVTLRPGASASFNVTAEDYNHLRNRPCPKTSAVLVIPPNTTRQLRVAIKIDSCGPGYEINPLIPGRKDLHPWAAIVR